MKKKEKSIGLDLTEGNISSNLLKLAVPMVFGNLLNVFYNIVDTIWIGRIVGADGIAAAAVNLPIVFTLISLASGITVAGNILVGQYYGAKDMKYLLHVSRAITTFATISIAIFVVIVYLTSESILRLLNTPESVFDMALSYYRITIVGFPFLFYYLLVASLLRGTGDTIKPLVFLGISSVLNIILDPIFISGLGPIPAMGLNGAAYATVFSQMVSVIISITYLKLTDSIIRVNPLRMVFDKRIIKRIIKIGAPVTVTQGIQAIGWMFTMAIVNTFNKSATAAAGIASRLDSVSFMAIIALSAAVATMSAQNIGAGKIDRVHEVYRVGLRMSVAVSTFFAIIALLFPETIVRVFTDDIEVITYTKNYLQIVIPAFIILSVAFTATGVINGAGKTAVLMVFNFVGFLLVRIPLSYFLAEHFGFNGIWIGMVSSYLVIMIFNVLYYLSNRWKVNASLIDDSST